MESLIILAAIAGVPVLLALFLRVSSVFFFVSIAAGSLLVTYVGDDAALAIGMFVRGQNTNQIAQLGLLLLPVVLSLIFLKKTMPKSKLLLHLPVLAAGGVALAALALPYLDSNAQEKIFANQYGNLLRESQDVAVAVAAVSALLLMWLSYKQKEDKKHKKHKKHH